MPARRVYVFPLLTLLEASPSHIVRSLLPLHTCGGSGVLYGSKLCVTVHAKFKNIRVGT